MKKIIVVYGDSNTGKTTVIDQVYRKLVELGAQEKIPRKEDLSGDFEAVLSYGKKQLLFTLWGTIKVMLMRKLKNIKLMMLII